MKLRISFVSTVAAFLFSVLLMLNACKQEKATSVSPEGNYPAAVNAIMMTKCVDAGCHNSLSYQNAAGLRLDSWDRLFDGGAHGAVVVPYDTIGSSLLYYINTDPSLGATLAPAMPISTPDHARALLTRDEYLTIRSWIAAGAPDKTGHIPFADNPAGRQKIYFTNQGNDRLSVIDAERHVIMRNIVLDGQASDPLKPHCVRVSADGMYVYACEIDGHWLYKINTSTDAKVDSLQLNDAGGAAAQWNIVHLSDDGSKLIAVDYLNGRIVKAYCATMKKYLDFTLSGFSGLHGTATMPGFDTTYITVQTGNKIVKLNTADPSDIFESEINLAPAYAPTPGGITVTCDPHEIQMAPDYTKYFVSCQNSNEVRVLSTKNDSVLAAIPLGQNAYPQDFALSKTKPYLFVSCYQAVSPVTGTKGAVAVINYNTNELVTMIYGDFWTPHGLGVDDQHGIFYVLNVNQSGLPSHCPPIGGGGADGWYSVYDLNTLKPVNTIRYESSVFPYSMDTRFK